MILKEYELLQMDEHFILHLLKQNPEALAGLSIKLLNDLKEARERLNQNPSNSSRPSGSLPVWDKGDKPEPDEEDENASTDQNDFPDDQDPRDDALLDDQPNADADSADAEKDRSSNKREIKRNPGRQPGSPGFGRTQKLKATALVDHPCGACAACQESLTGVETAYTGFQTLDLQFGSAVLPGLQLTVTQHNYFQGVCPRCGLENRSEPCRAPDDLGNWKDVGLTEWRLIGPDLAAFIVYLSMDMRITRRKLKRLFWELFGLSISHGTLQKTLLESARALEPVEAQLINDLCLETFIHADETSHPEAGERLWLWVFTSVSTAVFWVGRRTKEIFTNLFDALTGFDGYLMTDGYGLYRAYPKRLRCWAHLLRKAQGLCDSYSKRPKNQGQRVLTIMNRLMAAVYQARTGPDGGRQSIFAQHQTSLDELKQVCKTMATSSHEKTAALGKEFLNDWETIFRVLDYPAGPLTNNEAERALRDWVILRKITQGTRSEQGSRALALFASIFHTCRLRNASPLAFIRQVIASRRQGLDVPRLPPISPRMVAT